jgi:hypothetical protein
MFVRFRKTKRMLQVSLCEARWTPTGPRQEHVAQLGSIPEPSQTIAGRISFWQRLDERLARLANRISTTEQDKIRAVIAARIPPCSPDEVQQFEEAQKILATLPKDCPRDRHAELLTELREDLIPVVSVGAVIASRRAERRLTRMLVKLQRRRGRTDLLEGLKDAARRWRPESAR